MTGADIYDLAAKQKNDAPVGATATDAAAPSTSAEKSERGDIPRWNQGPIQIAAYDMVRLPDPECPMPERVLWWTLRDVYARFRSGAISKEQGEKEKAKAMRIYGADKSKLDSMEKLARHNAEMWREIERKACAYAKSEHRSEEADDFFQAVYGCRPKDTDTTVR